MKITVITYTQTFNTGNFTNQKLGVEIEIENPPASTGESNHDAVMDAFKQAKSTVEAAFKSMNPGLDISIDYSAIPMNGTLPVSQVERNPKEAAIDSQIEAINGCTSMKSLEIFKKLVDRENNYRLTNAYNHKRNLLSLQNQ